MIYFFPDFIGEELFGCSKNEEQDESLEMYVKCEKRILNTWNRVKPVTLSVYFAL